MKDASTIEHVKEPRGYLPAKVAEALRDHIPEELSKMMRDRLAYADRVIDENAELIAKNEKLSREWTEIGNLRAATRENKLSEAALEATREIVDGLQRSLDVERLQIRLDSEMRVSNAFEKVLAGLVRNTQWRESVLEFESEYSTHTDGTTHDTKVPKETTKEAE